MRKKLMVTLTGRDRVGIVEQVTKKVLENEGNVEESRMARRRRHLERPRIDPAE